MPEAVNSKESITEDQQVNRLNIRVLAAFCVSVICVVAVALAAWQLPLVIDARDAERAERQVAEHIANATDRLGAAALDHSYWNEAVEQLIYEQDASWADNQMSTYLASVHHVARVLTLDSKGDAVYEYAADEAPGSDLWSEVESEVRSLRGEILSGSPSSPEYATANVMVDGRLYLLAASPFVSYQPTSLDTDIFHGTLVVARVIDSSVLTAWASRMGLEQMRLEAPDAATGDGGPMVPLRNAAGDAVADLHLEPARFGQSALATIAPWGASLAVIFLVASTVMLSSLRHLVRSARSNIAELDEQKARLFQQAMFDDVSKLHNRNYLISRLEEEIAHVRRANSSAVFIFLDLDGFKRINDTMGHSAGDSLLRQVGERLVASVRDEDVVCRFGGDEFCILVTGLQERDAAAVRKLAEGLSTKVIAELERPFMVDDKPVKVGGSSGIVVIPDDTTDVEDILRFGDLAMYEAKRESGNAYIHYRQDFLHDINFRNAIRHKLDLAVPKSELGLHYQPIYDMASRKVVGYEALARWHSPELGSIPPSQFIAIAEETDTIVQLGRWVIEEALRDARALQKSTRDSCFIAINVAEKQLADPDFCDFLEERMGYYNVYPGDVHIELTESYRFGREQEEIQRLLRISEKGVQVSLDNFGTGYASLSYLQDYPLSTVKIDRNFVANVLTDSKMQGIIGAVVHMAQSLGIRVIASGIETTEQEKALLDLGCYWGQGFHYAYPAELETFVKKE